MKRIIAFGIMSLMGAVFALPLASAPKPNPASAADPQVILKHYRGKTWTWSEGASFWGRGGAFQAHFKQSVGEGKWYVTTKATLCYEADWKWREESGEIGSRPIKNCWQHVVDGEGTIWQRSHDKENWYRLNPDEVARGNTQKREYRRIGASIK